MDCTLTVSNFLRRLESNIRELKIDVYGTAITSDTLFATKTKSLTVTCFTCRIYLKDRKLRIETIY